MKMALQSITLRNKLALVANGQQTPALDLAKVTDMTAEKIHQVHKQKNSFDQSTLDRKNFQ